MKVQAVLAFAALGSAFVVPDEQLNNLQHVEKQPRRSFQRVLDRIPSKDQIIDSVEDTFDHLSDEVEGAYGRISKDATTNFDYYSAQSENALNDAYAYAQDTRQEVEDEALSKYGCAKKWLQSTKDSIDEAEDYSTLGHGHHGHHGHHKPNMTVYQLIASSKYTTKLAKLVSKYDDLVEALNGTSANFTVFAPTNRAFEKIPDDAPEPSKKFLKALLTYHVSPEFYPAGRVLVTRTIPTLLKSPSLADKPEPQRLATNIGFKGLTVNYYSRVVAVDIFGTNGVIHGVDSFIIPPPGVFKIIDLLPTEFSTLELGLGKTGLIDFLNNTDHAGGTFFAPTNFAFTKLGPRINAFLFSEYGRKYLKALLEYHVVRDNTLYSDAYYKASGEKNDMGEEMNVPKGLFHVDLPTLLKDRSLSVDVARYGRLIEIKINGFSRVTASDLVAYDGVLHEVGSVLIPPKKLANGEMEQHDGATELTEEDLVERLEPFVEHSSYWEEL